MLKIRTTAGTSTLTDRSFTFHTQDINYDIDWGNDQTFEATGVSGNQSHTFPTAGVHTIRFRNLNDVYINSQAGRAKYISVEQWGTSVWNADMSNAFKKASNLTVKSGAGTPDLSAVTNMSQMFHGATSFNGGIGGWNTASVANMLGMFYEATSFNGDIGGWNTAQVTNMSYMFAGQDVFTSFNGDISRWNTASVKDMQIMFQNATSFNGDISRWNTAKVTDMSWMFLGAISFDQNIGEWNVETVTTMENMFRDVTLSIANYDSLLVGWNRQTLQTGVTFNGGYSKYHSEVAHDARTNMISETGHNWTMTDGGRVPPNRHAPAFVAGVVNTVTYAENNTRAVTTVIATDADVGQTVSLALTAGADVDLFIMTPAGELTFKTAPDYENPADMGGNNMYEVTITATDDGIPAMTATQALTITVTDVANEGGGGNSADDFVLKITTNPSINAVDRSFTFHTEDTSYDIDWNNDGIFEDTNISGNPLHTFPTAGEYTIRFRNLTNIRTGSQAGRAKYTSIEQWGTSVWNADMSQAFWGAYNLTMNSSAGTPDMSAVTNMQSMFSGATSFNGDIGNWNTASVTNMRRMFAGAEDFTQDIGRWNTASVTTMEDMFWGATSFDQNIGGWNVEAVTNMSYMFWGATSFDQNLGQVECRSGDEYDFYVQGRDFL